MPPILRKLLLNPLVLALLKYLLKGSSGGLLMRAILFLVSAYGVFWALALVIGLFSSFALPLAVVLVLAYIWYAVRNGNTFFR